jgi:membrane-bound lytic murein transglycosylase B
MKFLIIITLASLGLFSNNQQRFEHVKNELLKRGVDTLFIQEMINHPSVQADDKYSKINVIPKPGKTDYSKHFNERSIGKTKDFLKENDSLLSAAEAQYGVPKEVIASILWVETRHGGYTGNHHIVSVYLNTALANTEEVIERNKEVVKDYYKNDKKNREKYLKKLQKRSDYKAGWALDQLEALWKISPILPVSIYDLEGSWAGAFGWSQFLPVSYLNWSVDGNGDDIIDLFNIEDAVFSVGNYLKTNGWGDSKKEMEKAVWHYNHSDAYVNAVLTLAEKSKVQ